VVSTVTINYRDPRPIYEQVRDGLRKLIVSGALPGGEKLPSVRELAAQLAINPNTIQRAYRELEQEGYLYSVPGKGSFAAERVEIDTQRRDKLLRTLDETVRELKYLGVTRGEIIARIGKGEDDVC
jgi:GntR family transcriptional regulator